ncbi:hypothetical protein ACQZ6F_22540 [Rhizobium sp. A22-96]
MRRFFSSTLFLEARFLITAIAGGYMLVNALNLLLFHVTEGLGQAGATAVVVPPMVTAMIYGIVPTARKLSRNRRESPSAASEA